jgi:hypothetical protein
MNKLSAHMQFDIYIIYKISATWFGAYCIILRENAFQLLKNICLLLCCYIRYEA